MMRSSDQEDVSPNFRCWGFIYWIVLGCSWVVFLRLSIWLWKRLACALYNWLYHLQEGSLEDREGALQ